MRITPLVFAALACYAYSSLDLLTRLVRNAFTPAIPRSVEPLYRAAEEELLAHDVTVVVGTKDTLSPTVTQLRHLSQALPSGVNVIYTYPLPPWEEAKAYARRLTTRGADLAHLGSCRWTGSPTHSTRGCGAAARAHKYTLLMHNDVFLLDGKATCSRSSTAPGGAPSARRRGAANLRDGGGGAAGDALVQHELHLQRTARGHFMSHEVDLLAGLAREPSDFTQRPNDNFLEDHAFLVRTEALRLTEFIDPRAAFTLEYVDLHLNMLRANLTQLYVPTARAEFRLWEVGWEDVPYFVRRRSEEQARLTKRHLEAKWGVEFPNTGFCNFVKFSIIRHVSLRWSDLPTRWADQAALLVSWFEMVGFNRHNDLTLGELLPKARQQSSKLLFNSSAGLHVTSRRELVPTRRVLPSDWEASGIGSLLRFERAATRLETRYQVEHMSLAVLRVPITPDGPFERERVAPLCGLLVRASSDGSERMDCWIYVAPHSFDHPAFQLLEWAMVKLRVGPRVALAIAMKLTNDNLEPGRHGNQIAQLRAAGVSVTMCGEHHWRCEVSYTFPSNARLLALSGRMNSWPTVVRTLLPNAEELHALYAALALLTCLSAAATASSATQAKGAVAVLAFDWLLSVVLPGILLGSLRCPRSGPRARDLHRRPPPLGKWLVVGLWLWSLLAVNLRLISRVECLPR